jgi:hypothetical protein
VAARVGPGAALGSSTGVFFRQDAFSLYFYQWIVLVVFCVANIALIVDTSY